MKNARPLILNPRIQISPKLQSYGFSKLEHLDSFYVDMSQHVLNCHISKSETKVYLRDYLDSKNKLNGPFFTHLICELCNHMT